MRGLERLPEPQILIDRKETWLNDFLSNPNKKRPDSSKYAHESIKKDLISMSFCKCFYCETKLKGVAKEVDHHIEVTVDETLSYTWNNLLLSCDNCNRKIYHNVIPIHNTLNPCIDDDDVIETHLTFNDELIEPKNNSDFGLGTIQKYRLDSELLDNRRVKQIKLFQAQIINIHKKMIEEKREILNIDEKYLIESFKRIDNPYSLMFKILIEKLGLF
jgi:hypothetical protein